MIDTFLYLVFFQHIMYLPNYKDGSIVNLMSSIARATGGNSLYKPLKLLNPKELKSKNVVLMVLDGLGYEYCRKYGKNSIFKKYLRGKMTSVFPSTTAACVTTFGTGLAPQQHGFTGWFMYFKEMGTIIAPLPYRTRSGGIPFNSVPIKGILTEKSFYEKIKVKSYIVIANDLIDSEYTRLMSKRAKRVSYTNLPGFFNSVKKVIKNKGRKFVYAYWPTFDGLCHHYGTKSKQVSKHFKELEKHVTKFLKSVEKTDTMIIITADHGLIDKDKAHTIYLSKHPKLMDCLTLPLSGETRLAYCYVKPSNAKDFERYVKKHLKKYCYLFKSQDLIKRKYYGLFNEHPKLKDRVGDYILMMKENYALKDFVLGEMEHFHIGVHGGVSKEEMWVPLIVIKL